MPVDAAPLISGDNYDSVVNVPATGEAITQAALVNEAVALGNRIEYLRRRAFDVAPHPERFFKIEDDFSNLTIDLSAHVVHSNTHWNYTVTGSPSVSPIGGTTKNPGGLIVSMGGGISQTFTMFPLAAGSAHFDLSRLEKFTYVARVVDNVADATSFYQVRMVGTDGQFLFNYNAGAPNWSCTVQRVSTAFLSTFSLTPYVSGEYIVVDVEKADNGDWHVSCNAGAPTVIAAANIPNGAATLVINQTIASTDAGVLAVTNDYVSLRAAIADRKGA